LLETADKQLRDAEKAQGEHAAEVSQVRYAEHTAKEEWARLNEELTNPERQQAMQDIQNNLDQTRSKEKELTESINNRQQTIDSARPELLEQDIQRFQKSAEQLEAGHQKRALELEGLQARLQSQGAEGLEEQYNEQTARLEHVRRRHEELLRRASALDLLLKLLNDRRQALTRRLQAPLQKHLDYYLTVLFSNARLDVDENLKPGTFSRGKELGQMHELSFGAREQMGLISRLAYADLLQEAGRPTLIILDDTLVHSDRQRLSQMKRILFDAAQRHQILLFTCHPDNWQDLGVAPRDIQAVKTTETG
jgi:DNA repair exonuclease SbcCD ATPase subunit